MFHSSHQGDLQNSAFHLSQMAIVRLLAFFGPPPPPPRRYFSKNCWRRYAYIKRHILPL